MAELCTLWGVRKSHTTPYHPQANGVVERGNRDLGDMLRSLLIGKDEEDWDLLLPQIMRTIRASPHKQTGETANFMMLGREVRLPEHLIYGPAASNTTSRERYAAELADRMEEAHDKLRGQQLQLRTGDRQEEPSFKAGQLVWLRTKRYSKGQSHKLQPKFTGPYVVKEAAKNHTYVIEQNGRLSREAESRLKAYNPAENPAGKIPTLVEPNRQLERKGLRQTGQASNSNEDTWLIRQKNDEKHLDSLLQTMLEQRNNGQPPPVKELRPLERRKSVNNKEFGVILPKEGSSNNLDSIHGDVRVAPPSPEIEDNSNNLDLTQDDVGVALPSQEIEDNPDANHEQEAEPSVTRDPAPISLDHEMEGGTVGRPQRVRRPPAWLEDFVTGGDFDQSLTGSHSNNTHLNLVTMAQKQIDQSPLELCDMWHLSDDEERKERKLPGDGLDISWVTASTKRIITDQFYQATAAEGKCPVDNCEYSTSSRRKLLEHLVTHYVVYVTDCDYVSSRRDSAVKHLRTCHGRAGSITQSDASGWSRLRESNPNLPTSCPPLPMSSHQYRAASSCNEARPVTIDSHPIAVKRIRTAEQQQQQPARPEQPPVVRVEQRLELRRRLARLREDYQAVNRIRSHIEADMLDLERQLDKKRRF